MMSWATDTPKNPHPSGHWPPPGAETELEKPQGKPTTFSA